MSTLAFADLLDRRRHVKRLKGFQNLMKRRVREILMLGSSYDSFILADDGNLSELILSEFIEHNLNYAPGLTRVGSGEEALREMQDAGRYSLIITTPHIEDMDVVSFARRFRESGNATPLALLALDERMLGEIQAQGALGLFDRVFMWSGDFRLFLSIIKLIEDQWNIDDDIASVGVQTILLVEDNIRFYSSYLPIIYTEIIKQQQVILSEGLNLSRKLLRMRARPKILHCATYEDALAVFDRYRHNVLGVISDLGFPRNGHLDPDAGMALARHIRQSASDIPICLQSSDAGRWQDAHAVEAAFIHKNAPSLLHDLQRFMTGYFSFGDFIFRMPDGREVARAHDLRSLEEQSATVPAESLRYHAERNHFSRWLKARTEFLLAARLRPLRIDQYHDIEAVRADIVATLRAFRQDKYRGEVSDFNPEDLESRTNIGRIGAGSLGGKARGLAFVATLLRRFEMRHLFDGVRIFVPATIVLATDVFDGFLADNNLLEFALTCQDDEELQRRFQSADFRPAIREQLGRHLMDVTYPLSVRSSSLLEDSLGQPFAGVYRTYMLPNNHPDPGWRLAHLLSAVKAVYASTFSQSAKTYIRATRHRLEEEKMAVIIQRIVGQQHGDVLYPHVSGVARTHNSYPAPPMEGRDGIVAVALGLGRTVVDGAATLSFCPKYPRQIAQLSSPESALATTQRQFFAVNLRCPPQCAPTDLVGTVVRRDIEDAEADGVLALVGSTYSPENHAIYDGTSRSGVRIVSFASLLKHQIFPLADLCRIVMDMGEWSMNNPVEIEFAANLTPGKEGLAEFAMLQMRPLSIDREAVRFDIGEMPPELVLCHSSKVLGNGRIEGVRDILFVDPDAFDRSRTRQTAEEVAQFNAELTSEGRPYVLIGMGRWGSSDPWLGVGVTWDQIAGARVIVETGFKDMVVEPSQGSHFFQNLQSFGVGYFTVNPAKGEGEIDWAWLTAQAENAGGEGRLVRRVRLDAPLSVLMDGRRNRGVILKPE